MEALRNVTDWSRSGLRSKFCETLGGRKDTNICILCMYLKIAILIIVKYLFTSFKS